MSYQQRWTLGEIFFAILAFGFVIFLHGAIPFVMSPCAGQAIWTTGFAKSMTHGGFFNVYAHDFGISKPAAMSFGLAGAWPMSILIRFGLHSVDAYSTICLCCLALAFFSAYLIARKFNNTRYFSLLGAVLWLSLPVIWYHASYGLLLLGMSLLSFYFLAALQLFFIERDSYKPTIATSLLFFLATLTSVFMDGYTFMMFFVGSFILFVFAVITRKGHRYDLLKKIFPVYFLSFVIAYLLYSWFIGKSNYNAHPIEVFRSYGADLLYIVRSTQGVIWLSDILGYSVARPVNMYFGDASVWQSTFLLPVIFVGLISWLVSRLKSAVLAIFLVAVFAFYMSLGPSLKINATIPEAQRPPSGELNVRMTARFAVMSTGNSTLSKHVPGFNDMRAAYRWSALEAFAFWCLIMMAVALSRKKIMWGAILVLLILINLPHLQAKTIYHINSRNVFFKIDRELISELQQYIHADEVVAFLPWGNDFFINYIAPMSGFRSYNIGGDKNLAAAQEQWPENMLAAGGEPLDAAKVAAGIKMLSSGEADALVFPYFNVLWHESWPCLKQGNSCLIERKIELSPFITELKKSSSLDVIDTRLFAVVRLKQETKHV